MTSIFKTFTFGLKSSPGFHFSLVALSGSKNTSTAFGFGSIG